MEDEEKEEEATMGATIPLTVALPSIIILDDVDEDDAIFVLIAVAASTF